MEQSLPNQDLPVRTMSDLVARAAVADGSRTAYVDGSTSITWAGLEAGIGRVAAAYAKAGLAIGDRIVLHLPTSVAFAVSYFGAVRAGLVVVPVNPAYTDRELTHVLVDSGARGVVAGPPEDSGSAASALSTSIAASWTSAEVLQIAADPSASTAEAVVVRSDDLAVLIYTSGTSGVPKGAMLSHRALLANREQLARIEPPPVVPADVMYIGVPAYHIYGLGPGLCQVAWAGATGVLQDQFQPAQSLQLITDQRVTCVLGVPQMYAAWTSCPLEAQKAAFAGVRIASSGAAPLPAVTLNAIRKNTGVTVWEGYGLTETAPVLTSTLVGGQAKAGSIGRAIPGVELALWDADGDPIDSADPDDPESEGEAGEIAVRGVNVFSGYWPDGKGGADEDGWFATGDIAYADDDGDLFLVDRAKELILVSGFNVYPREIEQVVAAVPGVGEVAAIGITDEHTGEAVKVFIVRAADDAGAALSSESVIAASAKGLARFKRPAVVEFVGSLPHSGTGKVRKFELREGSEAEIQSA